MKAEEYRLRSLWLLKSMRRGGDRMEDLERRQSSINTKRFEEHQWEVFMHHA